MIDEKALSSAMEAYSPQTQAWPDRERLARAITAYLQALRPGSTGETEGWVLVPKEPTDDMLKALWETMFDDKWDGSQAPAAYATYRAMLAAAGGENG